MQKNFRKGLDFLSKRNYYITNHLREQLTQQILLHRQWYGVMLFCCHKVMITVNYLRNAEQNIENHFPDIRKMVSKLKTIAQPCIII